MTPEFAKSLIAYIHRHWKGRLTEWDLQAIVFLSDYVHAVRHGRTGTSLEFCCYGGSPTSLELKELAQDNPLMNKKREPLLLSKKRTGAYKAETKIPSDFIAAIDHVICQTIDLSRDQIARLIWNTYPIVNSNLYEPIFIEYFAQDFRRRMGKKIPFDDENDIVHPLEDTQEKRARAKRQLLKQGANALLPLDPDDVKSLLEALADKLIEVRRDGDGWSVTRW